MMLFKSSCIQYLEIGAQLSFNCMTLAQPFQVFENKRKRKNLQVHKPILVTTPIDLFKHFCLSQVSQLFMHKAVPLEVLKSEGTPNLVDCTNDELANITSKGSSQKLGVFFLYQKLLAIAFQCNLEIGNINHITNFLLLGSSIFFMNFYSRN